MLKKILVAYDDGIHAGKALDAAIELAKKTPAEIFIGSAYTIPTNDWERLATMNREYPEKDTNATFQERNRKYLEKIQAVAAERVRQANIPVQSEVKKGKPGSVIVQMARDIKADLIIIGSHNRSTVGQLLLGSVSNYVLQYAECPVLIIKD